jgi:hypothetical protein
MLRWWLLLSGCPINPTRRGCIGPAAGSGVNDENRWYDPAHPRRPQGLLRHPASEP